MKKIKVLIADDHAVVREGTRRILNQEEDMEVVAEASDGYEAFQLATQYRPDVAIIDISMPKMDGIEATRKIKALHPEIVVLILSAYDDDQFVFSLLEAGAAGYLLKSVRGQELVDAIRTVHAGESVFGPSIAKKVLSRLARTPGKVVEEKPGELLTKREIEALKLITKGLSNKEIADELCLSIRTVQGRVGNIFNKLRVSSRTEAVVHALKKGWVNLDDVAL